MDESSQNGSWKSSGFAGAFDGFLPAWNGSSTDRIGQYGSWMSSGAFDDSSLAWSGPSTDKIGQYGSWMSSGAFDDSSLAWNGPSTDKIESDESDVLEGIKVRQTPGKSLGLIY